MEVLGCRPTRPHPDGSERDGLSEHLVAKEPPERLGCTNIHLHTERILKVTAECEQVKRTRCWVHVDKQVSVAVGGVSIPDDTAEHPNIRRVPFRRCSQDRRATSGHTLTQRRSGNKAARHGHKITRGRDREALPPARGTALQYSTGPSGRPARRRLSTAFPC